MASSREAEFNKFTDHCQYIAALVYQVEDAYLQARLFAAIETLAAGMNNRWLGLSVAWPTPMPDTIEGIEG